MAPPRTSRRRSSLPTWQRSRPHVETLEDRCVPSTVTNLHDAGAGSLRQAIADTPSGGTVDFQPGLSGTITLTSGELPIGKNLTIAGPGANVITVSGNHASRVFRTSATVTLAGLTIADGMDDAIGGGILNLGGALTVAQCIIRGNSARNAGGGIATNGGRLTVLDSVVSDNVALPVELGFGGGIAAINGALTVITSTVISGNAAEFGGGIYTYTGAVTITASTISGNSSVYGGGIESAGGPLTIRNSTLSGNAANNSGGGIYHNADPGTLTLTSVTISGNYARVEGGGIDTFTDRPAVRNSILAGNTAAAGPDVMRALASQGHNLIGDGSGSSGLADSDLVGSARNPIDPLLGPLQDNGGPTPTMALLPGSPAIDAGDNTGAPPFDQRGPGFPRIVNGTIDLGAFEFQGAAAPTITCSVADSLLWPPNHRLVSVGLGVAVDPPDAHLHLRVLADDHAVPADVADIGPDTLRLRAERQGNGTGRVYLIVVTATNAGGTSFDVCAVSVPHNQSPRSIAAVQQQAAAAEAYYREFQTAPPGYYLLGEGPDGGSGAPSAGNPGKDTLTGDVFRLASPAPVTSLTLLDQASVVDAPFRAAHELLGAWAALPVDGYFATGSDEGFRLLVTHPAPAWQDVLPGAALDLLAGDDRLLV
jgi:hypothetical protein